VKRRYRLAIGLIALVCIFCLTEPLMAGPLEDGLAAFERGDYATALHLLKPLAEQGYASAQANLGNMYANGRGVPQDDAEAVKWYSKAAEQGVAQAQFNLGVMYARGEGVPRDYVLAYMWFTLAAARLSEMDKREKVIAARDHVAAEMTPEEIAEAQALAAEWKPKGE
jgi:TPR repeat protein